MRKEGENCVRALRACVCPCMRACVRACACTGGGSLKYKQPTLLNPEGDTVFKNCFFILKKLSFFSLRNLNVIYYTPVYIHCVVVMSMCT